MIAPAHRVRVRYGESDQMGVAHHGSYIAWLEEARLAWMRSHGLSYRELEASGTMMPVVDLRVGYQRASRFDDELDLTTTATAAGPSRIVFTTEVRRAGELLATGAVTVASTDRNGRPVRIPEAVKALLG